MTTLTPDEQRALDMAAATIPTFPENRERMRVIEDARTKLLHQTREQIEDEAAARDAASAAERERIAAAEARATEQRRAQRIATELPFDVKAGQAWILECQPTALHHPLEKQPSTLVGADPTSIWITFQVSGSHYRHAGRERVAKGPGVAYASDEVVIDTLRKLLDGMDAQSLPLLIVFDAAALPEGVVGKRDAAERLAALAADYAAAVVVAKQDPDSFPATVRPVRPAPTPAAATSPPRGASTEDAWESFDAPLVFEGGGAENLEPEGAPA